jgi:hypothetical protein
LTQKIAGSTLAASAAMVLYSEDVLFTVSSSWRRLDKLSLPLFDFLDDTESAHGTGEQWMARGRS